MDKDLASIAIRLEVENTSSNSAFIGEHFYLANRNGEKLVVVRFSSEDNNTMRKVWIAPNTTKIMWWASSVKLTNSVRSTHFSFLTNCTLCLNCENFSLFFVGKFIYLKFTRIR